MTNDFTVVFSSVMTAPVFISEPVAASVGTVTMGSARRDLRPRLAVKDHLPRVPLVEDGRRHHLGGVHVGYESPSQFSREHSRLFGAPPRRDI
jgi:hypothetical protein